MCPGPSNNNNNNNNNINMHANIGIFSLSYAVMPSFLVSVLFINPFKFIISIYYSKKRKAVADNACKGRGASRPADMQPRPPPPKTTLLGPCYTCGEYDHLEPKPGDRILLIV